MLTYQEAITQILGKVRPLTPVQIRLQDALGLVLAEDIVAPVSVPPFANSAMDGYAVRAADIETATQTHPVLLPVAGEIAAGMGATPALLNHTALKIMTGAVLPDGADCVVPVEDTSAHGQNVRIHDAVRAGRFVRQIGEDFTEGTTLLTADTPLRPAEIGLCATAGRRNVLAVPRPRVAIISTGDELVEPGVSLQPGQIYNSNAYALAAQAADAGGIVVQRLLARDTPQSLRDAFEACRGADVILSSGGVSVGGYDYVKSVFAEYGTIDFWRVAVRPGKPLAFGTWGDAVFFGLPGNPVSSLVTFELFVRPALRRMRGLSDVMRPTVQARLLEDVTHEPGRQSYQRASVSREGDAYIARPMSAQGSHQLLGMVQANALLILPEHLSGIAAGEYVTVILLDSDPAL